MKRQQALPVERALIERELRAGVWFRQTLRRHAECGHVDPHSLEIVNAVGRYAALQVSVLALTLVRYSELGQVDLSLLSMGISQDIIQPKTTVYRAVGLPSLPDPDHPAPELHGVYCERLSYNCLYVELRRAVPPLVRRALEGAKDACHVFRHLRACWYEAQGYNVHEIAAALGQVTLHGTDRYLHSHLYSGTL
ncbi:hypothetical protein ES705_48149 [subsurface metagenome]